MPISSCSEILVNNSKDVVIYYITPAEAPPAKHEYFLFCWLILSWYMANVVSIIHGQ